MLQYVINDLGINNFNLLDHYGYDALSITIKSNSYELTKYLIEEYGLDIHDSDPAYQFVNEPPSIELFKYLITKFNVSQYRSVELDHPIKLIKKGLILHFQCLVDIFHFDFSGINGINYDLLHSAIQFNQVEFVNYFLTNYPQENQSLLFIAINYSAWDVFKHLITHHQFDPYVVDHQGNSILFPLLENKKDVTIEIINYVINDLGIDPTHINDAVQSIKWSPLSFCLVSNNFPNILQRFIDVHHIAPKFNKICASPQCTPQLIEFMRHNDLIEVLTPIDPEHPIGGCSFDVFQVLLQHNSIRIPQYSPIQSTTNCCYYTLIQHAAMNDDPRVLDYFLQHPNFQGRYNQKDLNRLLLATIDGQNYLTAQLLIEKYQVDSTIAYDVYGTTVLYRISHRYKPNKLLFRYLVGLPSFNPAQLVKSQIGFSILHHLISHQSIEFIQAIIDAGCNLNDAIDLKDTRGNTIFDPDRYTWKTVPYLLAKYPITRTLINVQNQMGHSIIHQCVYLENSQLLQALLSFHPDVELKDSKGFTPLLLAILFNAWDCAKIIIVKSNAVIPKFILTSIQFEIEPSEDFPPDKDDYEIADLIECVITRLLKVDANHELTLLNMNMDDM